MDHLARLIISKLDFHLTEERYERAKYFSFWLDISNSFKTNQHEDQRFLCHTILVSYNDALAKIKISILITSRLIVMNGSFYIHYNVD